MSLRGLSVLLLSLFLSIFIYLSLSLSHNSCNFFMFTMLCTAFIFESISFTATCSSVSSSPEEKQEGKSTEWRIYWDRQSRINADSTFLPFTMFSWRGQTLFRPGCIRSALPRKFDFNWRAPPYPPIPWSHLRFTTRKVLTANSPITSRRRSTIWLVLHRCRICDGR